jgi:hypothetical protein
MCSAVRDDRRHGRRARLAICKTNEKTASAKVLKSFEKENGHRPLEPITKTFFSSSCPCTSHSRQTQRTSERLVRYTGVVQRRCGRLFVWSVRLMYCAPKKQGFTASMGQEADHPFMQPRQCALCSSFYFHFQQIYFLHFLLFPLASSGVSCTAALHAVRHAGFQKASTAS